MYLKAILGLGTASFAGVHQDIGLKNQSVLRTQRSLKFAVLVLARLAEP